MTATTTSPAIHIPARLGVIRIRAIQSPPALSFPPAPNSSSAGKPTKSSEHHQQGTTNEKTPPLLVDSGDCGCGTVDRRILNVAEGEWLGNQLETPLCPAISNRPGYRR